jgi:hypothetical protein
MEMMLKLQKIMAVPTLHMWCENWTSRQFGRDKEDQIF